MMLATIDMPISTVNVQDPAGVSALRGASHNILYTVANSRMYENGQPEVTRNTWEYVTWVAAGAAILALLGLELVAIRRYRARKLESVVAVEQSASIDEAGAEKAQE